MWKQKRQIDRCECNAQTPRRAPFRCLGAYPGRDAQHLCIQPGERLQDRFEARYSRTQVGQYPATLAVLPANTQGLGHRDDGPDIAPIRPRAVVVEFGKSVQDVVGTKQVAHTHCVCMAQCFLRGLQHPVEPFLGSHERLIGHRLPGPDRRPGRNSRRDRKAVADGQMGNIGKPCRQQGRRRMVGDQHVRLGQGQNPPPGVEPSDHVLRFGKTADAQHIGVVHWWAAARARLWGQGRGQHGDAGCRALSGG